MVADTVCVKSNVSAEPKVFCTDRTCLFPSPGKGSAYYPGHFLFILQCKHNANAKYSYETHTETSQLCCFSAGKVQFFGDNTTLNVTELCSFPTKNGYFGVLSRYSNQM